MMHDTLINNLPPLDLRSIVRSLLSTGPSANASLFASLARQRLLSKASSALDVTNSLTIARCLSSAGCPFEALDLLLENVLTLDTLQGLDQDLQTRLDQDLIQTLQSCKEYSAKPPKSAAHTLESLRRILLEYYDKSISKPGKSWLMTSLAFY